MDWLVTGVVSGSVLLGGAAAIAEPAWRRWRAAGPTAPGALPPGSPGDWRFGDPRLAARLVTALCQLQRGFAEQDLPPPELAAVLFGYERLILRLARPAAVEAFPPWRAEAGDRSGLSWVVDATELTGWEPGPFPYPALAVVGRQDGWTVLLNLAQLPGPLNLTGDRERSGDIFRRLSAGLANAPWSRACRLLLVDPDSGPAVQSPGPEPGRVQQLPSLTAAAELVGGGGLEPGAGPAVLLADASGSDATPLTRFATTPHAPVVVLRQDPDRPAGGPSAGWTLRASVGNELPYGALLPAGGDGVEVRLLGPVEISAPGKVDSACERALAELVTLAALDPDGVPPAVADQVLSRPDPAATARRLHDWLGADPTGLPRLRERQGRWWLSPEVQVDWHRFRDLSSGADGEPGPGPGAEWPRLAAALGMIRGRLFSEHSGGPPVSPAAAAALHRRADHLRTAAIRAVRRAAALAADNGEPENVDWALRSGLTLLPGVQGLWRALLLFRAEHAPSTVGETVEQMLQALPPASRRRRRLEPATRKLLSRLHPRS